MFAPPDRSQAHARRALTTPRRMLKGADFLPLPEPGDPPTVTRFAPTPVRLSAPRPRLCRAGRLGVARAPAAAASCCGSRTSTARAAGPSSSTASIEDLRWLGLDWDGEPVRASRSAWRSTTRRSTGSTELGVLYPCFCTRRRIRAEIAHAGQAPHGPAGEALYPGICRSLGAAERRRRIAAGEPFALRLDVGRGARADRAADLARPARRPGRGAGRRRSATSCWRARTCRAATTWR